MFANVSIWQLLIVLVIVIAIFGTKRLKTKCCQGVSLCNE